MDQGFCCGSSVTWPLGNNVCMWACAPQDPFGDVIKKIMNAIHEHGQLKPNSELGSQNYEQWIVQMDCKGEFRVFSSSQR